ncbi:MAG: DUF2934 domain-containing protein [Mariprofundaceae bacterium]|nr:DUF2934 domain-containing protein [Mariprofundaceae bacterium]
MVNSKKTATKRAAKVSVIITPEGRRRMVAEAAYYLAEQRDFRGNCQLHDWLEAEARVERIYGKAA